MLNAPTKVLTNAESLCRQRGVRLTEQRRRVLTVVCQSCRPMGAYDILEKIREEVPRIAPPTVYRALDFLLQQGLVHKLETLHAFIRCDHPEHPHSGQFLICTACGDVTELEDRKIKDSLQSAAAASDFCPAHGVVEVTGTCAQCRSPSQTGGGAV